MLEFTVVIDNVVRVGSVSGSVIIAIDVITIVVVVVRENHLFVLLFFSLLFSRRGTVSMEVLRFEKQQLDKQVCFLNVLHFKCMYCIPHVTDESFGLGSLIKADVFRLITSHN